MTENTSTIQHDGRVFGNIPGINIGKTWKKREEIRRDGVHLLLEAGIFGTAEDGAYAVVLANGYKDDKDAGNKFEYTGSGGKVEDGDTGKRSDIGGPQVAHQRADNKFNAALIRSSETRRPVRVIRGPNPESAWAPIKGYRFDGLYIVDTWEEKPGRDGFNVLKFYFRRMEGQLPIPGTSKGDRRARMLAVGSRRNTK